MVYFQLKNWYNAFTLRFPTEAIKNTMERLTLERSAKSSAPFRFVYILQNMFHEVQAQAECFENTMPNNSCVDFLSV